MISIILSIISILSLITTQFENNTLIIISLIFSFIVTGISVGSYALISIRDLCLTKDNLAERMNHIGSFIPTILVIAFLLKVIINLLFFEIKEQYFYDNHISFFIYMSWIFFIFNSIGYLLNEKKEIEKIDLPLVIPCIKTLLRRKRIWSFILLYFICKIEKLGWQIIFAVNSFIFFKKREGEYQNYSFKDLTSFIIFFPPIFFGYIFDKYDFIGFKRILYCGCLINIVSCILGFFFIDKDLFSNEYLNIFNILSLINEIFRAGNYAIFLPEIIKKFEIKNLLIISSLISSSNLITQPIEMFLINYFQEHQENKNNKQIIILLIIQIICSIIIFLLLFLKGVNENLGIEKGTDITFVERKDIKFMLEEETENDD